MKNIELERATGLVVRARCAAAFRKRDAGEPRNPARAKPGQEKAFWEAGESVRAYDVILNLIEKEVKAERLRATLPARAKARRIADRALDFAVGLGITAVACLGIAAALLLLQAPDAATRAAAFAGIALGVARDVLQHKKQKPPKERAASCRDCPLHGKGKDVEQLGKLIEEVEKCGVPATIEIDGGAEARRTEPYKPTDVIEERRKIHEYTATKFTRRRKSE